MVAEDKDTVQETEIVKADDARLDEYQMAEQLYGAAGLDPVVDAGLKDYDEQIRRENKLLNKVLGPRESDIRGYGKSVAKRVAYAVYSQLNRQYGGKVGDMRSYIMTLEEERNHANIRYDELMGRVIGILGEEYKQLRTDSKEYIEKLTMTLGEDLKNSKIDQQALAESLGNIDGLRAQITTLENEKKQLLEKYESQIATMAKEHVEAVKALDDRMTKSTEKYESQIEAMTKEHVIEINNLKEQMARAAEKADAQITGLKKENAESAKALNAEIKDQIKSYETKITTLTNQHTDRVNKLDSRIAEQEKAIKTLESDRASLSGQLERLTAKHNALTTALSKIEAVVPHEDIGDKVGGELYDFILQDSKMPDAVIKGIGQFIDFRKYLKMAAEQGAQSATAQARESLQATQ